MNLNPFKKKSNHTGKKIDAPVYKSKLGKGNSTAQAKRKSDAAQSSGVRLKRGFLQRLYSVIHCDIKALWSVWRPRERIIYMRE
jgi:hypothetical protein